MMALRIFSNFSELCLRGRPISVAFVGPSVSPYYDLNPGHRLYYVDGDHDKSTRAVIDHESWTMNLRKANLYGYPIWWFKLYTVRQAFGVEALRPVDWDVLIERMTNDAKLFDLFYKHYYKASPVRPIYDISCKKKILCDLHSGRSHDRKNLCQSIESRIDSASNTSWKECLYNTNSVSFLGNLSNIFSSPGIIKNQRNTRRISTTAIKSKKRPNSNPDDTAEPTAGTSHGQVVGVDGTAATSGNKKPCSRPKIELSSALFSVIKETDHFVDKTKFIEVLFGDSKYVLITRPRRFGKSTNMDMVQEFVEKKVYKTGDKVGQEIPRSPENDRAFPDMNLRLFEDGNFEISKWDEFSRHRGKYPTIYLNLQSVDGDGYLTILRQFRDAITEAFRLHKYLLHCEDLWSTEDKKEFEKYLKPPPVEDRIATVDSSDLEKTMTAVEILLLKHIEGALSYLAQLLHEHFCHEIYLFIDEYDAPINNTIFKSKELCEKVNGLLTHLFKDLLKDQKKSFIGRALITGISYIGSVGLSGTNNVKKHMFLRGALGGDDRYEEFYGITEEELEKLTTKFTERFWGGENKLPKEKVNSYYNGYKSIGTKGVEIYPIWSIVHALENRELRDYWEQSGIMASASEGLQIPVILVAIEKLLTGKHITCEIPYRLELKDLYQLNDIILKLEDTKRTLKKPDLFLSFLMQQGYLTYVKEVEQDIFEVKIPNELIKREFNKLIENHFGPDYDRLIAKVTAVFDKFSDDLSDERGDELMKELISALEEVFKYVSPKWKKRNEDAYHCVIFHCLCRSSKYTCFTELRGETGRVDIAFSSGTQAVIIEVKFLHNALKAVDQIEKRNYVKIARDKLSNKKLKVICIGLNVDENNKVTIAYKDADKLGPPRSVSLPNAA